jgi:hypothetical protein
MTTASPSTIPVQPPESRPPKSRKGVAVAAVIVGAVALLGIGGLAGASLNSHNGEITSLHSQVRSLTTKMSVARDNLRSETTVANNAKTQAATATATAQARAKAQCAGKVAAANALLRKLRHEQGVVQSSTISADGVYVVGKDIPSGTYHTTGGGECYFATLNSTNTFDIIDNNNFSGPETVDVSGATAFQISGGCTWTKIG